MNYSNHYERLIAKHGNSTKPDEYSERHHIIPKCLGGKDEESNLTYLSAEAHYTAHQLLVKMNPSNLKLIYAAWCMTISKLDNVRGNKAYSWLRKQYSLNHPMKSDRLRKIMAEHGRNRVHLEVSKETRIKRSVAQKLRHLLNPGLVTGKNNPMYGVKGENHHLYGKRGENSLVYKEKNGMFGVTGENHHCYGKIIINNGIREARLTKGESIPEGWKVGRKKKCST